jgi:F-type H+-transporting ATPase subunit gamma
MQMVAASKLRRAQTAALAPRDYTVAARELLARLGSGTGASQHPLYQVRPVTKALVIVIAGDRGMSGGYNSNVMRSLGKLRRELGEAGLSAITIGARAGLYVAGASDVEELAAYDVEKHVASDIAVPVLREAVRMYEDGEVDAVHLIYTKFVSTVKQEIQVRQLLPVVSANAVLASPRTSPAETLELASPSTSAESEYEPEVEELIDYATRRILEAELTTAILESRASEEAARMVAMMNATDNADEIIGDLTLVLNNARQAMITQEISEITAGAEAIA